MTVPVFQVACWQLQHAVDAHCDLNENISFLCTCAAGGTTSAGFTLVSLRSWTQVLGFALRFGLLYLEMLEIGPAWYRL